MPLSVPTALTRAPRFVALPADLPAATVDEEGTLSRLGRTAVDLVTFAVFCYILAFVPCSVWMGWTSLGCLMLAMIAWRVYRLHGPSDRPSERVPYTCSYVRRGAQEMFLVGTVHICPRSPLDVEEVIDKIRPHIVLIERPAARRRVRDEPRQAAPTQTAPEDFQLVSVQGRAADSWTFRAQRAPWNSIWADEVLRGGVVYDEGNAHGLRASHAALAAGSLLLVQHGSPNGTCAAFALKAFLAHQAGAKAVLVIDNSDGPLPSDFLADSLQDRLRVFCRTWSCGSPAVPVMLLTQEDGQRLRAMCEEGRGPDAPVAALQVLPGQYPRKLVQRVWRRVGALLSIIGIMYDIIECFSVQVGREFSTAALAASQRGIPCAGIDVGDSRLCRRLWDACIPTPGNVFRSLCAWFAFPRDMFWFLFPPQGSFDDLGSGILYLASFSCRTWIALVCGAICASLVALCVLSVFGVAGEQAAERSGAGTFLHHALRHAGLGIVHHDRRQASEPVTNSDRALLVECIVLAIELYLFPRIHAAVVDSRDETMYKNMKKASRAVGANRCVVVVGAGHANGIIRRARERGL